jgi:hypothetical protein
MSDLQLIFLATVVFVHELSHTFTKHLFGPSNNTPHRVGPDDVNRGSGESGWYVEKLFFLAPLWLHGLHKCLEIFRRRRECYFKLTSWVMKLVCLIFHYYLTVNWSKSLISRQLLQNQTQYRFFCFQSTSWSETGISSSGQSSSRTGWRKQQRSCSKSRWFFKGRDRAGDIRYILSGGVYYKRYRGWYQLILPSNLP